MQDVAVNVRRSLCLVALMISLAAGGQPAENVPRIGYVYPAGGQVGSTFEVIVGGQFLRGAKVVQVSGEGVGGTVTGYVRPLNNDTFKTIKRRLQALRKLKTPRPASSRALQAPGLDKPAEAAASDPAPADEEQEALPELPILRNLEMLNLSELQYVADYFADRQRQKNAQIAEVALVEITIDPAARPGERELRLGAAGGLTNPVRFQVGLLPETMEHEPNDPPSAARPAGDTVLEPPVLLNGQILPGDVDRVWFHGRKGQALVVEVAARALNPYLADAVPGWFQASLALYGSDGRERAFQDDFRFSPDPVLYHEIPEDGDYALEISDALYRGRDDFVYRIAIGELPYITGLFPLGGQTGEPASAAVSGWNLPAVSLVLDTRADSGHLREARMESSEAASNPVAYAVDDRAGTPEIEPNDVQAGLAPVVLPAIIDGRIDRPGDCDRFAFSGRAGDEVVAEIYARRLQSPVDSVLYLLDASGNTVAWNDDMESANTGLLTHHADSYIRVQLPQDGTYSIKVAETQRNGGDAYAYRLHLGPPQPDFELYVTPSSLNFRPGSRLPVTVHAIRKDGFEGAIDFAMANPEGPFALEGGTLPAGKERIRLTMCAPQRALSAPVPIEMVGSAEIGGTIVRRSALPAEDMMQAFLYRHLVPAQQLLAGVTGGRRPMPPIAVFPAGMIAIPAGGTAEVHLQTAAVPLLEILHLTLSEPPDGLSLAEVRPAADGLTLVLKADGSLIQPGFRDSIIVAADMTVDAAPGRGAGTKKNNRVALGVLPAIPIEVVAP